MADSTSVQNFHGFRRTRSSRCERGLQQTTTTKTTEKARRRLNIIYLALSLVADQPSPFRFIQHARKRKTQDGRQDPPRPLRAYQPALLQHRRCARPVRILPARRLFSLPVLTKTLCRTARNSKPLEVIGTYDPVPKKDPYDPSGKLHKDIKLDITRAKYWVGVGAQPTDTVWRLLSMACPPQDIKRFEKGRLTENACRWAFSNPSIVPVCRRNISLPLLRIKLQSSRSRLFDIVKTCVFYSSS